MAEHSTADREVPGSNPGTPFFFLIFVAHISLNTIVVLEVVLHRFGGIAQWQSIRLQIERSLVQIRVPPPFFLSFLCT